MAPKIERCIFRLGVIEVGPGYVSYINRTARGKVSLSEEQEKNWRSWIEAQIQSREEVSRMWKDLRPPQQDVFSLFGRMCSKEINEED